MVRACLRPSQLALAYRRAQALGCRRVPMPRHDELSTLKAHARCAASLQAVRTTVRLDRKRRLVFLPPAAAFDFGVPGWFLF